MNNMENRAKATADIAQNLGQLRTEMGRIAHEAKRDPHEIELIAVSKFHPLAAVEAAMAAGQFSFGENRVQEAVAKFTPIRAGRDAPSANPHLRLHLVGPLQSNKARIAAAFFDEIHSLDRENLAVELVKLRDQGLSLPKLYVQINTGEEAQKSGLAPDAADDFIEKCRKNWDLPIIGLMCVPPQDDPPELHFALLLTLAKRHGLAKLSMGMSHDFAAAIQFGATAIRVGTAIFGTRAPAPAASILASQI